ncbi:hypothetical protein Sste5346_003825 [Sporothrix stenoceras]|uniref:SnoaL-like domain-containing protein n=1 Tax=Sporothrix stenoceras TaxID=5173 RepID=A0ABR3ZCU4_9PEZI
MSESAKVIALREKNRKTVDAYIASGFGDLSLFSEDAYKELSFATYPALFNDDNETPMSWKGKEALTGNFKFNADNFRGGAKSYTLFSTNDPSRFFAEMEVEGTYKIEGKTYPYRQPYYIMTFTVTDGLISLIREVFNPLQLLKTSGSTRPEALTERYAPLD